MARIRTVKPSIFGSLTVCAWPLEVRWTFLGLFTYADDHGRGLNEPKLIKAALWPMDERITPLKVAQHVALIEATGPLHTYETAGQRLLHITSWLEHQRISHPTDSILPPCPNCPEPPSPLRNSSGTVPEPLANGSGPRARSRAGVEGKGREGKEPSTHLPADLQLISHPEAPLILGNVNLAR